MAVKCENEVCSFSSYQLFNANCNLTYQFSVKSNVYGEDVRINVNLDSDGY